MYRLMVSKLLEKFSCPVKKCPHQFFESDKFITYFFFPFSFRKWEKFIKTWCGQDFRIGQGMLFSNLLLRCVLISTNKLPLQNGVFEMNPQRRKMIFCYKPWFHCGHCSVLLSLSIGCSEIGHQNTLEILYAK